MGEKPMPLSELPGYIKGVKDSGQGDYAPVVEMGRIVESRAGLRMWHLGMGVLVAACLMLSVGIYGSTREISIVSGADARQVADIVSSEGGRVFSVREEDGTYRVRVFTLKRIGSFLEGLRGQEEFDSVSLD